MGNYFEPVASETSVGNIAKISIKALVIDLKARGYTTTVLQKVHGPGIKWLSSN